MKKQTTEDEANRGRSIEGSKSINMKNRSWKPKEQKKMKGLSLEAFADAKSGDYNPSTIKKQREFYKNAKYVKKYKKTVKQQSQQNEVSTAIRPYEDDNKTEDDGEMDREKKKKKKKKRKKNSLTLRQLYEKKYEEEVKKRKEREAIIQAKKEEREKAQARRKATRENMLKKTRSGQPVMKYRIEHLLESLQGATRSRDGKTH